MQKGKGRELFYRILAGLILIPLSVYLTLYADKLVFFIIIEGITLLAVKEFISLTAKNGAFVQPPLVWAGAVALPVVIYAKSFAILLAFIFILIFVIFILKMFSSRPTEKVIEDVSLSFFTVILIPFLFSFMILLRDIDPYWLVFLYFVIWSADTGAYFTGITLGKRRLIPSVSPGKTVEGLIGGTVAALAMAFGWNYFRFDLNVFMMALIAADIIVAGVAGDLFESMMKRGAMVKDSGKLIPGHGGILDRFDSLVFSAPVLFFYLYFVVK